MVVGEQSGSANIFFVLSRKQLSWLHAEQGCKQINSYRPFLVQGGADNVFVCVTSNNSRPKHGTDTGKHCPTLQGKLLVCAV
jgi:hypothetical protein